MTLELSTDSARLAGLFRDEIALSGLSLEAPAEAALESSRRAGDLLFVNPDPPRASGAWCHPESASLIAIQHMWGPSTRWLADLRRLNELLIALGYTNYLFGGANVTGSLARRADQIIRGTAVPGRAGVVTGSLATSLSRLIAAGA